MLRLGYVSLRPSSQLVVVAQPDERFETEPNLVILIAFNKLRWPGDNEGIFRSYSQATTCPAAASLGGGGGGPPRVSPFWGDTIL